MTISQYFEFAIEVNPHFTFIQEALEILLYVPDERVKPKIIEEIVNYYSEKLNTPDHRVFIYRKNRKRGEICSIETGTFFPPISSAC